MSEIILCVGTGCCGFRSFYDLMNRQQGVTPLYKGGIRKYQNSREVWAPKDSLAWDISNFSDSEMLRRAMFFMNQIRNRSGSQSVVCEISHYTLPYIPYMLEIDSSLKVVCLKGEKEKTVHALWSQWAYRNPLVESRPEFSELVIGVTPRYAVEQFPDLSSWPALAATREYWDVYYKATELLEKDNPDNVIVADSTKLFSDETYQGEILRFLNLPQITYVQEVEEKEEVYSTSLCGGLGNNLFQMAEAVAFAAENNLKKPSFATWKKSNRVPPLYQPDVFLGGHITEKTAFTKTFSNMQWLEEQEIEPHVSFVVNDMFRFAQIHHMRSAILEYFEISKNLKEEITQKYPKIEGKNTTSLHVRFGGLAADTQAPTTIPFNFYYKTIASFPEDEIFFMFSDNIFSAANLLRELEAAFPNRVNNFLVIDEGVFTTLAMMSMCTNHILHNSTLSFWGAYLDKAQAGRTIVPQVFFKHGNKMIPKELGWEIHTL